MKDGVFERIELTESYVKKHKTFLGGIVDSFVGGLSAECAFAKTTHENGSVEYSAYVIQGGGDGIDKYNDCISNGGVPVSYKEYKECKVYNSNFDGDWLPKVGDEVYITDLGAEYTDHFSRFVHADFVKVVAITKVRGDVVFTLYHGIFGAAAIVGSELIRPADTSFRCWVRSHFK